MRGGRSGGHKRGRTCYRDEHLFFTAPVNPCGVRQEATVYSEAQEVCRKRYEYGYRYEERLMVLFAVTSKIPEI